MANIKISYETVKELCDELVSEGIHPNVKILRQRLKDRGSFSTLTKMIKKWERETTDNIIIDEVPEDIENLAFVMVKEIWKKTNHLNKSKLSNAQNEHLIIQKKLESETKECQEEIESLEKEYFIKIETIEILEKKIEDLKDYINKLESQNSALREFQNILNTRIENLITHDDKN